MTNSTVTMQSNEEPTTPQCIPIKTSPKQNHLPSSYIEKHLLVSPSAVIEKYPTYITPSRLPPLARKLAEKSYFGVSVLKLCTVSGCREVPALPLKELNELKSFLFSLLPQFWTNPVEFETVWVRCTVSIGQLCKTIRLQGKG